MQEEKGAPGIKGVLQGWYYWKVSLLYASDLAGRRLEFRARTADRLVDQ